MGKVVYTRDADGFMALIVALFELVKVIIVSIFGILLAIFNAIILPACTFIYREYIQKKH